MYVRDEVVEGDRGNVVIANLTNAHHRIIGQAFEQARDVNDIWIQIS